MKKLLFFLAISLLTVTASAQQVSFHDHTVETVDGHQLPLGLFEGMKVMVVNVASQCGFTPQYQELQQLYDKYSDSDFVILAFPSNDFGGQEPGTNEEIRQFCHENYGVTFPVMSKINVVGDDAAPLYRWLAEQEIDGQRASQATWNFQKYLIDRDGRLVRIVEPKESPLSKDIIDWIEAR